jgi:hypothetical protein
MKKVRLFESFHNIEEAKRGTIHKAVKAGDYPATIVVIENGKVVHQETVNTPEAVPASFNVLQKEYPKAKLHVEDKGGKTLFVEGLEVNEVKMVKAKRGHNYYQLYKDTPIKYISGRSGMGLDIPGVLLHNQYGTLMGKEGAYIIDYFGQHFYVDMKNKFATSIVNPKDEEQNKDLMQDMGRADIAPDHSSWKKYLNESVVEESANVTEKKADGTISDDEDVRRADLLKRVKEQMEEILASAEFDAKDIGGSFRAPGIMADIRKELDRQIKKFK